MKHFSWESDTAVAERLLSHHPQRSLRDVVATVPSCDEVLPELGKLDEVLGLEDATCLTEVLNQTLFGPVQQLVSNRGKRIRAQLVTLCHRLVDVDSMSNSRGANRCKMAAEAVELIHLGSLVVDDIEDGSQVRRGQPALHVRYGTPVALNAGNWLYFWSAEVLRRLELSESKATLIYELYHRTMVRAHFGQGADLGCRADGLTQTSVAPACLATMELKTGALMGFAAALGGAVSGAPKRVVLCLDEFGKRLGVALQMFDDLGNVIGRCEPAKRHEDLLMKRLCWVWACAAKLSSPEDYQRFVAAVRALPDEKLLNEWMAERKLIPYVRESAGDHLDAAFRYLEAALKKESQPWSKSAFEELRRLGEEIAIAYE